MNNRKEVLVARKEVSEDIGNLLIDEFVSWKNEKQLEVQKGKMEQEEFEELKEKRSKRMDVRLKAFHEIIFETITELEEIKAKDD